jgi:hypothetical protein
MNPATNTGLTLNILEINPSKENVSIYRIAFKDHVLKEYRKQYPQHYFYRDGNQIYAWNVIENPSAKLPNEFSPVTISRKDNTLVFNKIIESGIIQWFKNNKSKIYHLKYSSTQEVEFKKDIKDFKGLKVIPVLNFSVHPFFSKQSQKLIAALSIRFATKFSFDQDEKIYKALNVDTRNLTKNQWGRIIASTPNIAKFLSATGQTNDFNTHRNTLNTEQNLYKELVKFISIFNDSIRPNLYLPDGLGITSLNFHNVPNSNFIIDTASKPGYFFYQERTGTGYYNSLTKDLKPYSFDHFNSRTVKLLVITPDTHEGTTETFIKNIEQRLKSVFHLYNISIQYLTFDSKTESYEGAVSKFDCNGFDLAIVTVSNLEKSLPIKSSPYYITKAKLLNQRIPTQEVTVEVMRRANELIYEAIALNIYSKIGGSAWTIAKVQKQKTEVIIGISSTLNYDNQRIIGFANIFDYNGNYLIGDCSTISNLDNYAADLEKYLTIAINNLISQRGIDKSDAIRLIFHLSKEAGKQHEIKAIENTLKKFGEYNIQFGIVHLSYNHNLRLFSNSGTDTPLRGTYIELSTFQALLHLGKGTKIPIFIRLDQRSTYRDLFDTCKQVLYFCHLCYRNFRPANVPVTIKYPSLMAKLTDELSQVPKWDTSQLNNIKDKLWFI